MVIGAPDKYMSSTASLQVGVTLLCSIDKVLALLKPYRRRQVSEAERTRLRELSVTHGFKTGRSRISERDFSDPETTQTTT